MELNKNEFQLPFLSSRYHQKFNSIWTSAVWYHNTVYTYIYDDIAIALRIYGI